MKTVSIVYVVHMSRSTHGDVSFLYFANISGVHMETAPPRTSWTCPDTYADISILYFASVVSIWRRFQVKSVSGFLQIESVV